MEQQIKSYANPATAKTDADILAADGWFVHSMISDTRPPQEKNGYRQEIVWYEGDEGGELKHKAKKNKGWHVHSITAINGPFWFIVWHKWESSDNILVTYRRKG